MIYNAGKEVVQLDAADRGLGSAARRLARILTQTLPKNGSRRLVHGTFYARHVLDQGDGVGVIDWQRVLAWHRAAALLRLASKVYVVERRKENWLDRARSGIKTPDPSGRTSGSPSR